MGAVGTLPFILRFCEMVGSIIAFSVVVEYHGDTEIKYIMFTGISGLVVAVLFMMMYVGGNKAVRGKFSAVVDGLWFVFWLAAAGVATHRLTDDITNTSRMQASTAFCWITWFLWTVSLGVSVQEARGYEYGAS